MNTAVPKSILAAITCVTCLMIPACGPKVTPNIPVSLPAYPPTSSTGDKSTGVSSEQPIVRIEPFHDRVMRANGGKLTAMGMLMGNVVFDPQIATVLEQATAMELTNAGMRVITADSVDETTAVDFVVTGAIDEFVVSTTNSLIDWDVKLELRVSLGLFRPSGGTALQTPAIVAICNEKTMARPGGEIVGRLTLMTYKKFSESIHSSDGLIAQIRSPTGVIGAQ